MTSTFMEWLRGVSLSDVNVRGAVAALLASLVLIVALALLARAFRRLRERYQARIERREITLRVQRWEMVSAERIQRTAAHRQDSNGAATEHSGWLSPSRRRDPVAEFLRPQK